MNIAGFIPVGFVFMAYFSSIRQDGHAASLVILLGFFAKSQHRNAAVVSADSRFRNDGPTYEYDGHCIGSRPLPPGRPCKPSWRESFRMSSAIRRLRRKVRAADGSETETQLFRA